MLQTPHSSAVVLLCHVPVTAGGREELLDTASLLQAYEAMDG